MKINAEKFGSFLELINLSNEIEIKECILRGDTDKLSVIAVTATKVVIASGELKGDYSALGVVGVDNLTMLKNMIKSFSGEIELTKTASKIVISNGKKLKVELAMRNPQYVLNEVDKAKYDVIHTKANGNVFTLTPVNIDEFARHYNVFGKEVIISGNGKEVNFNITSGDNKLDLSIPIAEDVKKFEVKTASLLMKIFQLVKTGEVKVSANDGAPAILVSTKTDEYEVSYIIAPLIK